MFKEKLQKAFPSPGKIFFIALIAFNVFIYFGSFSHIFRHDDWNYWYQTRGHSFDLKYVLNFYSFDRFSNDPILSVGFRPLALTFLAIQKFFFGSSYELFHIFTMILHFAILYVLLKILLEIRKSFLAYLFVFLTSVLCTGFDLVIWSNNNFYLLQIFLILLSIYLIIRYKKAVFNNNRLFSLIVLLQFPIMFFNEAGLVFIIIIAGFMLSYNKTENLDRAECRKTLYFLVPIFVFLILYGLHRLYGFAYTVKYISYGTFFDPETLYCAFNSTVYALGVFLRLIFFPSAFHTIFRDSVWFFFDASGLRSPDIILGAASLLLLIGILSYRKLRENKSIIILTALIIMVYLYIASMGRVVAFATPEGIPIIMPVTLIYVGSVCRFAYIFNVFFAILIYSITAADKLKAPLKTAGIVFILLLALLHSQNIVKNIDQISGLLAPLKPYFDQVRSFVECKKNERDFSFKVVTPPPKIDFANWWGEGYKYCIEGHFFKYLKEKNPKYVLKYDYDKQVFTVYTGESLSGK